MKPLSRTTAGRMQLIEELLDTNIYDEDGNVIGVGEAKITAEDARRLLEMEPGPILKLREGEG